ncbi:MAG: glycosyltransferase family 4 protein [Janthinobacterium lividum]
MHPHLAIDAHVIDGRPQGSRTVLIQLLRAIARTGRASDFLLFSADPVACAQAIGAGSEAFRYAPLPYAGSTRRLLAIWPGLLRAHGDPITLFQYIVPPFARARVLVSVHDVLPITHPYLFPRLFRWRSQALFTLSMFRAQCITTVSRTAEGEIARRFPSLASRIRQVTNGPSFDAAAYFAPSPAPPARPYVLAVGRIEPRKNMALLARAFVAAAVPDLELVIVGRTDHGHRFAEADLPGVRHLADVSDDELVALYRGAALFVFPSAAEGFGLPLLDALLFGLPTISSDRTAMPEVAAGLASLFDPTQLNAATTLAARLRGHFTTTPIAPPTLEQRRAQLASFSWDRAAQSLLAAFDEVAGRP